MNAYDVLAILRAQSQLVAPRAGWLTDITDWVRELVKKLFIEFMEFAKDLMELYLDHVVDLIIFTIMQIPTPAFLDGVSICGILSSAGPIVGWTMSTMHLPEGMALIAAAFVFRMVRKALTLFQW